MANKRQRGDFMPFHNFTGAVKIKTGDVVTESKSYKVKMHYKEKEVANANKRQHKFYNKQQQQKTIYQSEEEKDEYPCEDEKITYKPSMPD